MDAQIKQLLKDHSLRLTQGRIDIISIFLNANYAVSHADIEGEVKNRYDRVTIYRTLKSFLDKGLIHKVLDDEGGARYALCDEACGHGEHQHDHIHFKCMTCGQTTCLEHVHIPAVELPKGFKVIESNFLVSGVCQNCNV